MTILVHYKPVPATLKELIATRPPRAAMVHDQTHRVHHMLYDTPKYRALVISTSDADSPSKGVKTDRVLAAVMIQEKAAREGLIPLATLPVNEVVKSLNVALRRDQIDLKSRKQP